MACTIAHKAHQFHQGLGGKQNGNCPLHCISGKRNRVGEVGPVPGERVHLATASAEQHPGGVLAPEHVADASGLPTGATLLRPNGGLGSLKCNIGCYVFWG